MTKGPHRIGDPPIELTLRRNARARRYALRIGAADGRVTLTIPARGTVAEALEFARSREGWLRGHLAGGPRRRPVLPGAVLPVDGVGRVVRCTGRGSGGAGVRLGHDELLVAGDPNQVGPRLRAFLRARARDRFAALADGYAARFGKTITSVRITDARTRWGSCSAAGGVMFSWRLAMAPRVVQDYVAAHEAAHLLEMNHGRRFWQLVAEVFPEYETARRWLRSDGRALQLWDFESTPEPA